MTKKNENTPDHEKYPRRWVMGQGYVYDKPKEEKKEPKDGQ